MAIYNVDWSSLLSPSSILPPDISFRIILEDGKEEMLEAHRTVLCILSPVFRAYLSEGGSWHNSGKIMVIKDVSGRPFRIMLDFFYKKDFNISNQFSNIEELFEILKVADLYQVETLANLCKKSLLNFPMELKSVVHIVNTAKYYKDLAPFATISQQIIELAMDSLTVNLKTAADILNFVTQSDTDSPVLEDSIKLELLKKMARRKCDQCGLKYVRKGCNVTREDMVVAAWVEVTKKSMFIYDSMQELEVGEQGKITGLSDASYDIVWDKQGSRLTYYISRDLHVPMRFICKCDAKE